MKNKQTWPVVITTIFPPNQVIAAYTDKGFHQVIVGDKKTPNTWNHPGCEYLSVEMQVELYPELSELIPFNHYGRKNIGYLQAMRKAEALIETDDDNLPLANYPNFTAKKHATTQLQSKSGLCNIYQHFLTEPDRTIWPRGFPLDKVLEKETITNKKVSQSFFIQQGLINGDTDVDAIYRLTNNKPVTFADNQSYSLAPHTYAPINTQNTFWMKQAFMLLYLPVYSSFRSCDIHKGWIAQRLVWELGSSVLFLSPSVLQERNPHDYLKDFESEVPLFLHTNKFIEVLESIQLSGSIGEMLIQVYTQLVAEKLMDERELPIVRAWVAAVEDINN